MVRDRAGYHDWQFDSVFIEHLLDCEDCRFRVQGIEYGLDQDDIGAPFDQSAGGFGIGVDQLLECYIPVARIIDVRRDRTGAIGRPSDTRDKSRFVLGLKAISHIPC